MLPRSTHETFAQKLYQTFKNHKRFAKPKLSRSDFTICHYAGDVSTECFAFILLAELVLMWKCSLYRLPIKHSYFWTRIKIMLLLNIRLSWVLQNVPSFLAFFLFCLRIPQNPPSFHPLVLDSRWIIVSNNASVEFWLSLILPVIPIQYDMQQQLQSLLETLSATEPHYIRCVKPNNLLKPAIFENQNVLQQLRCGVSISISINVLLPTSVLTLPACFRELWKQLG